MQESKTSNDDPNTPLVSFLIHAATVIVGFAVLAGAVFYWLA